MSKNNNLGEVIASLSKSEKRYFRISTALPKKNKQFLKIFDLVEAAKDKDRKNLNLKLKGESGIKNLPAIKTYLYKAILDSLHTKYDIASADYELYKMIHQVGILYDKGLFNQALSLIDKAKGMVWRHEQLELLPEIHKWELNINQASLDPVWAERVIREQEVALKIISNLYQYKILNAQLFVKIHRFGVARSSAQMAVVEKIMKHPMLRRRQTLSVMAEYSFYSTWGLYFKTKSDLVGYNRITKNLVRLIEKNKNVFEGREMRYVQVYSNLLLCQRLLGRYGEIARTIDKLKAVKSISKQVNVQIFVGVNYNKLSLCIDKANFNEGYRLVREIMEEMKGIKIVSFDHKFALNSAMAYICFAVGQFSLSLQFLNSIISHNQIQVRQDIQSSARILYLVTRYEMDPADDFIENITKSAQYFLKGKKILYESEKLIIDFFLQIIKGDFGRENIGEQFIKLKINLNHIFANSQNEKVSLLSFDYMSWIESKITGRAFHEIVKEQSLERKYLVNINF